MSNMPALAAEDRVVEDHVVEDHVGEDRVTEAIVEVRADFLVTSADVNINQRNRRARNTTRELTKECGGKLLVVHT